jgi:hypothetical protein
MRLAIRRTIGLALSGALLSAAVITAPADARAADAVSGTGKGIAGGALLGAEIGFVGLSVAGAKQTWMYYVIPGALAIGGGVGGYFIEKDTTGTDAQVPMYMLAAGMALIIPTVVITLSANAYQPGGEDSAPSDAKPADAGGSFGVKVDSTAPSTTGGSPSVPTPGASGSPTTTPPPPVKYKPSKDEMRAPSTRPLALLNFRALDALQIGVPVVALKPVYTREEVTQFGQAQKYELHAPVVSMAF